jgi:hypothetical protein
MPVADLLCGEPGSPSMRSSDALPMRHRMSETVILAVDLAPPGVTAQESPEWIRQAAAACRPRVSLPDQEGWSPIFGARFPESLPPRSESAADRARQDEILRAGMRT